MIDGRASLYIVPNDPDLRLRPSNSSDASFIWQLFREVRGEQFIAAGLSGPILKQILEQQFRSQTAGYAAQFPGAISSIVTRDGVDVGRLLLDCASERWHIVDIALMPAVCGCGVGTKIIEALEAGARQRKVVALTLSVLATNAPARRFYLRQGFAEVGQAVGSHIAMRKDLA